MIIFDDGFRTRLLELFTWRRDVRRFRGRQAGNADETNGILKTARESGSVALSLVGVRFAEDSTLEGGVRCELVSAAGPTPPIKGSFIAGLMNS
jgi:hypothetical protein